MMQHIVSVGEKEHPKETATSVHVYFPDTIHQAIRFQCSDGLQKRFFIKAVSTDCLTRKNMSKKQKENPTDSTRTAEISATF